MRTDQRRAFSITHYRYGPFGFFALAVCEVLYSWLLVVDVTHWSLDLPVEVRTSLHAVYTTVKRFDERPSGPVGFALFCHFSHGSNTAQY